jgi:hypothetical protein
VKRITNFLFSAMLFGTLTACGKAPAVPIATPTVRPTATATYTPSPTATYTPTATATPVPLKGRLFFDMNGSGLPDKASFNYDKARLNSPLNQLERDYIAVHPDTFFQPEQIVELEGLIKGYIDDHPGVLQDEFNPILLKALDEAVMANPSTRISPARERGSSRNLVWMW